MGDITVAIECPASFPRIYDLLHLIFVSRSRIEVLN